MPGPISIAVLIKHLDVNIQKVEQNVILVLDVFHETTDRCMSNYVPYGSHTRAFLLT